jgi:flagellar hook-associated protein 3 FlgL
MRLSTANSFDATVDVLQRRQADLRDAQERLASGKRVARASDDPGAAARAERALAAATRSDASQRALDASRNAMTLAEGALSDAGELLQQVRETLVAAGNASYSDAERKALAERLVALRQQLFSVANRGDGAGGYLFAGQGAGQAPFIDTAAGTQYRGVTGESVVATDETLPLALDGEAAWLRASTGNGVFETRVAAGTTAWIDAGHVTDPSQLTGATYRIEFSGSGAAATYSILRDGNPTAAVNVPFVSGQAIEIDGMSLRISGAPAAADAFEAVPAAPSLDVFATLDRTIAELRTADRTSAQVTQTMQSGIRDIDQSMTALQSLRARVGETLNMTDTVEGRIASAKLAAKTERSAAEDLDLVQAISDFQGQQTGYDAALKTYSMVQRLSLFQYIQG